MRGCERNLDKLNMTYNHPGAMLLPKMEKKGPFSMEVPGVEKVEGETIPRRNSRCKDGLITELDPSIKTIYDIVRYATHKFQHAPCIGTRTLIDTVKEKKVVKKMVDGKESDVPKEWSYFQLSPYKFMSFVEFQLLVRALGNGLREIGLAKGDKIHLYGATRYGRIINTTVERDCSCRLQYELGVDGTRSFHSITHDRHCV